MIINRKLMKLVATDQPALHSLSQKTVLNVYKLPHPSGKWIANVYFPIPIKNCKLMKLVASDQPALFILSQMQFALHIGWQDKCPSNVAINFFYTSISPNNVQDIV